jgi:hemerythrin-like domain-containing protein
VGIQIGAKPDAGFDDPLGMLQDCHRRVERFLNILVVVVHRARGRALSDEERAAVESSLNYFRGGGRRHTADEEESLFPRMRELGALPPEIEALEHDHEEADPLHDIADRLYTRWIENGTLSEEEGQHLGAATERLRNLYSRHIQVEDTIVFPRAAQMLSEEALSQIGQEFRKRRNV